MNAKVVIEYQWPYLLTFFPPEMELSRAAREFGALKRKRGIESASALLRLALVYGFCGLSLRQTAAWAQVAGVADISNVALLNRLRGAADWLGWLLGLKLAERAPPPGGATGFRRVRLVDATSISRPGSEGTDWRIHLGFDLAKLAINDAELTDNSGGESLTRFAWEEGDLVLGDRGYAHRKGMWNVVSAKADFIIRLNWRAIPLQGPDGGDFDLVGALRGVPEARPGEYLVQVAPSKKHGIPPFPARLVAIRKTEEAAEEARRKVIRRASRKQQKLAPITLESAGYVFALTTLPSTALSAADVLELYRFRWQIELAFKRLKGLLHLGALPAQDPNLARSFLYAKLLAGLLLEDFTTEFLAFSPWGYRLEPTAAFPLADPADSS